MRNFYEMIREQEADRLALVEEGKEYNLILASSQDGYMAKFADGPEVTGGYDFKLTAIDPKHVYVGMFASRNVDVTFSDIHFEI